MKKSEAHKLHADPGMSAAWAGLRYTSDEKPGYTRKGAGKGFYYLNEHGDRISDAKILERLKGLVIPPAWTDVWISKSP
ncbi:MAG: DNA topoisomerase IB, partial [Hymenobacteraceae bacterium]|nr:DNA topoisomerase IB [Hymenobacteraceae bacterium]